MARLRAAGGAVSPHVTARQREAVRERQDGRRGRGEVSGARSPGAL